MIDIIGSGFGRTGTTSLSLALRELGWSRVFHNMEIPVNPGIAKRIHDIALGGLEPWQEILRGYQACLDFPCCVFWRDLTKAFPEAKVIHTTRNPEDWYDSIHATIFAILQTPLPEDPKERAHNEMSIEVILKQTFDMRLDDRAFVIEKFKRHEAEVRALISSDRLLVYDVGEGWGPLCEFLDVSVPDAPFPNANSRFTLGLG